MIPEITEKPFDEWWNQIIYEDPHFNYKLSRKKLILSSAEKDGFAHFDLKLDDDYRKFLKEDSLELMINGEKIEFINNPAKNSIRQIGYEVILTLEKNLKHYCPISSFNTFNIIQLQTTSPTFFYNTQIYGYQSIV